MQLDYSSRPSRIAALNWLLGLALLAQAAIPLQAHTALAADSTGQVVVICTWDGPQERPFPYGGAGAGERLSPAFLFSQLLASADLCGEAIAVNSVLIPIITLTESPSIGVISPVASLYSIRAPPLTVSIDTQIA